MSKEDCVKMCGAQKLGGVIDENGMCMCAARQAPDNTKDVIVYQ